MGKGKVRIAATADGPGKGTKNMQARIDRAARITNKHLFAEEMKPTLQTHGHKVPIIPTRTMEKTTTKRRLSKAEKRRLKKKNTPAEDSTSDQVSCETVALHHPQESVWRKHLEKFYTKHNPAKLENPIFIENVLKRIGGQEAAFKRLFATLNERYPNPPTGAVAASKKTVPAPKEIRAGDWLCLKCETHNFMKRTECVACKTPRGQALGLTGEEPFPTSSKPMEENKVRKRKAPYTQTASKGPIPGMERIRAAEEDDAKRELSLLDIKLGVGASAANGELLSVQYRGTLDDGTEFGCGRLTCTLGSGEVVRGLDLGLAGMKEGGTRAIRIPPRLGYGDEGRPSGGIPGGAWLLFVVNLLRVGRHRERGQRGGSAMLPLPNEFLGKNREKLLSGDRSGGSARDVVETNTGVGNSKKKTKRLGRREKRRLAQRKALELGKVATGKVVSMKRAKVRTDE